MDVLTLFANSNFRDLGATALLGLVVVMILMGRLNPRSVAEFWKNAYLTEKKAGEIKDAQIAKLIDAAHTSARALDALPKAGGEPDASDTEEVRRSGQ